jgi:hypothetical protein
VCAKGGISMLLLCVSCSVLAGKEALLCVACSWRAHQRSQCVYYSGSRHPGVTDCVTRCPALPPDSRQAAHHVQ